ncbi:MAG: Holliday junction resolvase RuvX [Candidatus Omnitrophica bacterium]|nr:Holliday junction resolvase RuvX [Candidatus Omnitrophota bacterium]MBU1128639.1 Holliday junction resolvase RuvX [Candidatus Omnitrophota bacterium]MBU1657033.1 Holliday junction resolvase RuvX [Candidatus Omnitrophota bacterium]MBU1785020.1 Holliday junction resolvase RuvX [Candidatus Omnitrophota bacterium]MBU1852231.1 Holliday junction resolvase RuvX [Candidatus Omnitrophota bacterium]
MKKRVMALDVGTKRIGVAVSDEIGMLAQARGYIERLNDRKAVEEIHLAAEKDDVGKIVIGLPINMDGTSGERACDSRRFAGRVKDATCIPVVLWDERLSTKEAERVMLSADVSRKKRKEAIDKLAAQIILQGYLDARENGGEYV